MGGQTPSSDFSPRSPGVPALAPLGGGYLRGKWSGIRVHPALSEGVEDKRPAAQNPGPSLVSNQGPCWKKCLARHVLPSRGNNGPRCSLAPRAATVHCGVRLA